MSTPAPRPETYEPDPGRWRTLAVCLAVGFITLLDVSVVNVALPSIERSLDAGPTQLQLVVAGYTLAFGLVLVPAGRLGDAGWRRHLFIGGLIGFLLTSLAAGLAPTDDALAVARLAQGVFAGMLNPQVVGLIQQQFRGFERGRAFGLFGATIGVSTAVGPLLGGVILAVAGEENGWRWVFGINVPIILVLLPFAWKYVPTSVRKAGPRHLDAVGLGLIGAATVFVMYPFVTTSGVDDDPARWWGLVVAAVALVALVAWERRYQRRTGDAVLDPGLLRTPSFRNGAILGAAYFSGFTGVFLLTTLYLQNDLGYDPLAAGLVAMPFAVCSGVSAWLSGRLVHRWGRTVVVAGLVVVLVGMVSTDLAIRVIGDDPDVAGPVMALTLAIAGAGSGLVISPNQTLALADVPVERAGVAGSMIQLGQRIGSSLGIAAVLSLYYAGSAAGLGGAAATGRALLVTITLVAVALVVSVVDLRARHAAGEQPDTNSGATPA
ncbi:drug resistance transporter, EmrB/QacA subfamily [Paraoerskovia marina]|uniref:Drug resistance transporter, EmrB/QacA subfamily n=1 Tax=Paraoerskovia marina TaxID=545619 RepID=A0A1H1RVB6_9CELL|nr:MFS transporter [Paraoerskovia marina]SDS39486.1 drug resistance transporter, EmrB/QacA subfamily [Paraoerskovia marina]